MVYMNNNLFTNLIFSNNIYYRISRHFLFWIVILFYFSAFLGSSANFWGIVKSNLLFIPLDICTTYIIIYLIFSKLLKGGKQIIWSVLLFIILIIIHLYLAYYLEKTFVKNFTPLIIVFVALFIKSIKYLYLKEISYRELEQRNLENKMTLLTSQLHPHFLFNTLNNLYTLSLEKSEKLPEMIMGLSSVMRYITEDQRNLVEINKELEVIDSYIDIEKIRYDERLVVEKSIILDDNEKSSILIPPLLIFTFVENAFKHGVSKSVNNPRISIQISTINKVLKIKVENSIDDFFNQKQDRAGIGLKNVKKRLELYYPDNYKYSVQKTDNCYRVKVELSFAK